MNSQALALPGGPNVTLVAFHGERKPEPLRELLHAAVRTLESKLPTELASHFECYTMSQMHATLLGMETDVVNGRVYGRWLRKNRQELREISVAHLHRTLTEFVATRKALFTIRFGGFPECFCTCRTERRDACREWSCATSVRTTNVFHSCDRTPYEGSFYAVAPGPAVITGWPVAEPGDLHSFTHGLYAFRRSLEQAGFADKYHYDARHEKAHWKNDDCFIRIGTFREPLPLQALRDLHQALRRHFSESQPVVVEITPADVCFICYADPSLRERDVIARIPLQRFLENPSCLQPLFRA